MDLGVWLRGLGLERYEAAFRENEIDDAVLRSLTAEDLKDLGVSIVGHRRKLLDAIAGLRADASLKAPPPEGVPPIGRSAKDTAERRQLTVMFVDLVGSTALSARLDPEDMREIIGAYHRCCAEQITKAGGFVAKYMGDGVLAYFGYPQAHEDDAERAVLASLAVVDAVPKLRAQRDAALQVRIGLATGLVVVGDLIGEGVAQEHGVVGDTPNLAARLQSLAEPGQVVIANSSRRLTGGMFEYRDLGGVTLKGLADPVHAWQVLGASTVESRFEAQHEAALTPLVGREEELELLLRRWQRAKSGEGQVVLLSGEPGIGKSRLTVALQERLQCEPLTRVRYFCSPQHIDSAFHPVIDQLERAAQFDRLDTPAIKFRKLASLINQSSSSGYVEMLAEFLSIPSDDLYEPSKGAPLRKKEQTIDALLRQLEALTLQRPVLMVFEDVHWIDPSTREILDLAVTRTPKLPLLLVITFRPELQAPWVGQPHVAMLHLNRLGRREGAALVETLAGTQTLPPNVMTDIVERTDGIPLFVEELTRAVIEAEAEKSGGREVLRGIPVSELPVPASLYTSLMARLDRLGMDAKSAAQTGAVIGREFSYQLLATIINLSAGQLDTALARLTESGILFARRSPPDATYLFKHALVRDAAYGSLLRTQRRTLHASIASAIEREFPEIAANQPEFVAQHFAEANSVDKAIWYWLAAGEHAMTRSAMEEAIAQLRKGLSLASQMPPERRNRELVLRLWTALGTALTAAKGYAAQETGEAYAKARQLCEELNDGAAFARVGYGQYLFHLMRAEVTRSHDVAREILAFAEDSRSEEASILGHRVLGVTLYEQGQFSEAREHMRLAQDLLDQHVRKSGHPERGREARVMIPAWTIMIASRQGYLDQALAARELALNEAKVSSLHSQVFVRSIGMHFLEMRREYQQALREAGAVCDLAREVGFPHFLGVGLMFKGIAKAHLGDAGGVAVLEEGLNVYRSTGTNWALSYWLGHCASAPGQGREAAWRNLEAAFTKADETGEEFNRAELHRIRGDLALSMSVRRRGQAEADYLKAVRIAVDQGAKLLELRASTSLARLWYDQGKRTEARDLLAPIYDWFTEGFDTPDLEEAKALLDTLLP
jgi:class 3 adenylate cyclase/predicted ATPase